jgi:hypothetical protein
MGTSNYLFISSMDVDPDHDRLLNEVYDSEHLPDILKVAGVRSAVRFRKIAGQITIGGIRRPIADDAAPIYHVLYTIERPDVLTSDAWKRAVEQGRWASQVRPHTTNRRQLLLERLDGQ